MKNMQNVLNLESANVDLLVEEMSPLVAQVEADFTRGVAIYGAGFVGTWACGYLQSMGVKVVCFVDRDPQKNGTTVQGIPVVLPTDPLVSSLSTIFIAARHAVRDVMAAMVGGNSHLISFDGYFIARNYKRLTSIRDGYFTDKKSVETFNAILIAMLTGRLDSCRAVMEKDMYFGVPEFSGTFDEIFVDAGAFVGDTVERFVWENLGTFRHLYAFEPGARQFSALQKRMGRLTEEWAIDHDRVSLVNEGLSFENGRMSYSFLHDSPLRHGLMPNGPESHDEKTTSAGVCSLDSYLNGKPVTFIKADVEGMEMDLLRGAQATIRRFKPKMALCVYHYPSDLFEIAEFVKNLVPEYKFCLRQHAPILGDYVLYCYI